LGDDDFPQFLDATSCLSNREDIVWSGNGVSLLDAAHFQQGFNLHRLTHLSFHQNDCAIRRWRAYPAMVPVKESGT
jgi:hypothetical protein